MPSCFDDPTDRSHEGRFSYSSCEDESKHAWDVDAEDGEDKLAKLPFDGLVPFFTKYAHPNLPIAVTHLMREHGVKVTCSKTVLDEGDPFWTTGQPSDENYAEIVGLSAGLILTPIGHVEQLLSAGLACVYKNGAKAKNATKERPHFYSCGYLKPNDLQVWFKFEGQRVCLQLMDWKDMGPGGLAIHMAAGSE